MRGPRISQLRQLRPQRRAHLAQGARAGRHLLPHLLGHREPHRLVGPRLARRLVGIPHRAKDITDGRPGVVKPPPGCNTGSRAGRPRTAGGIQPAQRDGFHPAGHLAQQPLAQRAGIVEDGAQLRLRLLHKVVELADDGGVQMPDQHLDQPIAKCGCGSLAQFLTNQCERGPQAHACRCHARWQRQHADQVDPEAGPVEHIARAAAHQHEDVVECIDQCHDVAQHGQATGHGLDARQRHQPATGLPQPRIDLRGTPAHILHVDGIERGHCCLGRARSG